MNEETPGARLRRARERAKLSQAQLADIMQVKRSTLNAWERGDNPLNRKNLDHLAAVQRAAGSLRIPPRYIFEDGAVGTVQLGIKSSAITSSFSLTEMQAMIETLESNEGLPAERLRSKMILTMLVERMYNELLEMQWFIAERLGGSGPEDAGPLSKMLFRAEWDRWDQGLRSDLEELGFTINLTDDDYLISKDGVTLTDKQIEDNPELVQVLKGWVVEGMNAAANIKKLIDEPDHVI